MLVHSPAKPQRARSSGHEKCNRRSDRGQRNDQNCDGEDPMQLAHDTSQRPDALRSGIQKLRHSVDRSSFLRRFAAPACHIYTRT